MKKSLLALAVLGAFAGAASAQSNVTVYGIVDADVARVSANGVGVSYLLDEGNNGFGRNGSRLGFKGSEDLGGGLSAIFQLEAGFDVSNGAGTQTGRTQNSQNQTSRLFGRQAYVGLSSKALGNFTAGRQYTVAHIELDSIDPFSTGMAGNIEGGVAAAQGITLFSGFSTRMDNSVQYATPNFAGFTGVAQYSFGETNNGFAKNQQYGLSGDYNNGPIHVMAFYMQAKPLLAASGTLPAVDANHKGYGIGGSFDFKVVKLHAAYGQDKTDNNLIGVKVQDNRNGMIGFSAPFGAVTFVGSYIRQDDRLAADADHDQFALGAIYDLSKRTNVYTSAGYLKGHHGADGNNANLVQVGLQHRF